MKTFTTLAALLAATTAQAATVPLASVMDPAGTISENAITGSFAEIGRNPDGLYNLADPSQQFGAIDLFPNERNFVFGSLTYDDTGAAGTGVEVFPATGLDASGFWQDGSSTTDLNDATGFDFFFFGTGSSVAFGAVTGTVEFTNGMLSSIDVTAPVTFTIDHGFVVAGPPLVHSGSFSISENVLSVQVNDAQTFTSAFGGQVGSSTLVVDLQGKVLAVVPEPTAGVLALLGLTSLAATRRRFA